MDRKTQDLVNAIGYLYDAAIDPTLWERFMHKVADLVNGNTGVLVLNPDGTPAQQLKKLRPDMFTGAGMLAKYTNFPQELIDVYMEKFFFEGDVWRELTKKNRINNTAFIGSELISAEELKATDFYKEVFNAGETKNEFLVGTVVDVTPFGGTSFSISRNAAFGDFDENDKKIIASLIPHFQRARLIYSHYEELRGRESSLLQALNASVSAIALLDLSGRIIYSNEMIEKIFNSADGIGYLNGKFLLHDPSQNQEFEKIVGQSIQTSIGKSILAGGGLQVLRPSGKSQYRLFVTPLNTKSSKKRLDSRAAAAVFIYDTNDLKLPSADMLKSIYGLTEMETNVAHQFYQSFDLKIIAEHLGLKITTVRTHFYRVLEKTGTRSQPELMQLLDQLPR